MIDWKEIRHFTRDEYPRFVLLWCDGEAFVAENKRNRQGEEWWEAFDGATDDWLQKPSHFAVITHPAGEQS